jgi:hypothetical protein
MEDYWFKRREGTVIKHGGYCLPKSLYEKIEGKFGVMGTGLHIWIAKLQKEGCNIWFYIEIDNDNTFICWKKGDKFIPTIWECPLHYMGGLVKTYKIRSNSPLLKTELQQKRRFWRLVLSGFDWAGTPKHLKSVFIERLKEQGGRHSSHG